MIKIAMKILELFAFKGALKAVLSWPVFSMASFKIITRAKIAGVFPRTVIDIGGNIGQFSIAAQNLFDDPKIFSIEPDPTVALKLKKNLQRLHGDDSAYVDICAVSNIDGEAEFFVNYDNQTSSIMQLGEDRKSIFKQSKVIENIKVSSAKLDTLFRDRVLEKPILLKIDAQGAEGLIIDGAEELLNDVKWIILEVPFINLYNGELKFNDLVNKLASRGFSFDRPLNFHLDPKSGGIMEMDGLFVHKNPYKGSLNTHER